MSEFKKQVELGSNFSGRPEGVSDAEWEQILKAAKEQVVAERSKAGAEMAGGQLTEANPNDSIAPVGKNLGTRSEQAVLTPVTETQAGQEELRRQVLQRALDILNGNVKVDVNNPSGVAELVDALTK